jgi:hypothetical protein
MLEKTPAKQLPSATLQPPQFLRQMSQRKRSDVAFSGTTATHDEDALDNLPAKNDGSEESTSDTSSTLSSPAPTIKVVESDQGKSISAVQVSASQLQRGRLYFAAICVAFAIMGTL